MTAPLDIAALRGLLEAAIHEADDVRYYSGTSGSYLPAANALANAAINSLPALLARVAELEGERLFLLDRAANAGSTQFGGNRWTGISSNALVDIAFGRGNDSLPSDASDLASCYRMLQRLPAHLLTASVAKHLRRGEGRIDNEGRMRAQEVTGWHESLARATLTKEPAVERTAK